ncbi:hypothetical protein ACORE2_13010 [Bacillus thuringiensis]|uniref:hypothetical protein n=1 Tax=Bacillus thuringiensis TaxID=1428 RepID=UPI00370DF935
MEDTISLAIFGLSITGGSWLLYVTYEPIRKWAWSDIEQNKKTHGSGSVRKNNFYKYTTESREIVHEFN